MYKLGKNGDGCETILMLRQSYESIRLSSGLTDFVC